MLTNNNMNHTVFETQPNEKNCLTFPDVLNYNCKRGSSKNDVSINIVPQIARNSGTF